MIPSTRNQGLHLARMFRPQIRQEVSVLVLMGDPLLLSFSVSFSLSFILLSFCLLFLLSFGREDSEIFSVKFSFQDDYVVAGLGDGSIRVYKTSSGELVQTLHDPMMGKTPCTNVSFRPNDAALNRTQNVIAASYADGKVRHWHITSGQKLSEFDESSYLPGTCKIEKHLESDPNQSLAVSFFRDGSKFVTAGSDCTVRIYDEQTQQPITTMFSG